MPESTRPAPLHRHEIRISIGANTREYVAEVLTEILKSMEGLERIGNSCSGGWNGSYSVTSVFRDIEPDAYREELEAWRESEVRHA